MGALLDYYNVCIKPANDRLGRLLADVHCEHCGYISRGTGDTCPICDLPFITEQEEN